MADLDLDELTAVVTPAGTDLLYTVQGGTDKKLTVTQALSLVSAGDVTKVGTPVNNQVGVWTGDGTLEGDSTLTLSGGVLSPNKIRILTTSEAAPAFAFQGETGTGIYRPAIDNIGFSLGGTEGWRMSNVAFFGKSGSASSRGAGLLSLAPGATVAGVFVNVLDGDNGLGYPGTDQMSLIAGGQEALRFTEVSSEVIATYSSNVGLTADVGSAQGNGVILSTYNVYSTVGTAGDAATLPSTFPVGTQIYVKNDAATNSMDVFPASGDDAGAGANTAVAVAAGDFAVFIATAVDATWTKLLGGTA